MKISARCNYACRAVLELALYWPNEEPLQMQIISEKQDIPFKYIPQVLLQLKRMGIVRSIRGKDGGYLLARPPHMISLGEIVRKMDGELFTMASSMVDKDPIFVTIWQEVEGAMAKILDKVTFEDIIRKAKRLEEVIIYQI